VEAPEIHILNRIRWQFFWTGTFANPMPGPHRRRNMLFAFLRTVAALQKVHFKRMLWVARDELGEVGGRPHYHALLGGFDPRRYNLTSCFAVLDCWRKIGGGHTTCTLFDRRLSAVDYLTKPARAIDPGNAKELRARGIRIGGDRYESAKFGSLAAELTIARSVLSTVKALRDAERKMPPKHGGTAIQHA
jgi:hypothetical protein